MIEEVASSLYKIELPLPRNPLKSVNCYLMKGSERSLLVDAGMNRMECREALQGDLQKLNVDLNKTDFFLTHFHADHIGLVSELSAGSSKIYFNKEESLLVKRGDFWKLMAPVVRLSGFAHGDFDDMKEMFSAHRYGLRADTVFHVLSQGDDVKIGDYCFTCIETPGHSPGHICLYDATKKLLCSGDHILGDITPNISGFGSFLHSAGDFLKNYLESLEKTRGLEVALVLPGHRHPFHDHRKRISELKTHHEQRLLEIVSILQNHDGLTVGEIAALMTWDIKGPWNEFPQAQKWFSASEAFAHLVYLVNAGEAIKQTADGVWRYFPRS